MSLDESFEEEDVVPPKSFIPSDVEFRLVYELPDTSKVSVLMSERSAQRSYLPDPLLPQHGYSMDELRRSLGTND